MLLALNLQESSIAIGKSEVASVRVEPHIKAALQSTPDREMRSLANMVEVMVVAYCRAHGHPVECVPGETLPNTIMRGSAA